MIEEVKNTLPWTYVIRNLNDEKVIMDRKSNYWPIKGVLNEILLNAIPLYKNESIFF